MPPGRKDQRRKKLKKSLVWVFPPIRVAHPDSSSLLGYKNYEAKLVSLGTEAPRWERASVGQIHTCRTHFSHSHLEESQTSPTGQAARLVPIISEIVSKACGQCSTRTSFWAPRSQGFGWAQRHGIHEGHCSSKGVWGTHWGMALLLLHLSWDILTAPLCHRSFSGGLTRTGGCLHSP